MNSVAISHSNFSEIAEKFVEFTENQGRAEAKIGHELAARATGAIMDDDQNGKWTWTFRFR